MAGLLLLIPPMFVRMEQRTTQPAITTLVSTEELSPTATQLRPASMVVLIQIAAPPPLSAKVLRPASPTR